MKYNISSSNLNNEKKKKQSNRKKSSENLLILFIKSNSQWLSLVLLVLGMLVFSFSMKYCEQNTSVDAYLSRYNFEKARKAAQELPDGPTSSWDSHVTSHVFIESDKAKALLLIISQEVAYCIQQKQYEKAIQTANEIFALFSNYDLPPDANQTYDDILNKIVESLIRDSNYDYAKKITVSYKSDEARVNALEKIRQIETQN